MPEEACIRPGWTAKEEAVFRAGSYSMLSQKAKYAIKALLVLARAKNDELVQVSEIADSQSIPKKFLDLIFFELRRHGLIQSTRGRDGGYALSKPAAEISIADIVRAVDGPLAPLPCASVKFYQRCTDCEDEKTCEVRRLMREVRDAASIILDNTSLAEAASFRRRPARGKKRAHAGR
jgi:Rrf2 family protein